MSWKMSHKCRECRENVVNISSGIWYDKKKNLSLQNMRNQIGKVYIFQ